MIPDQDNQTHEHRRSKRVLKHPPGSLVDEWLRVNIVTGSITYAKEAPPTGNRSRVRPAGSNATFRQRYTALNRPTYRPAIRIPDWEASVPASHVLWRARRGEWPSVPISPLNGRQYDLHAENWDVTTEVQSRKASKRRARRKRTRKAPEKDVAALTPDRPKTVTGRVYVTARARVTLERQKRLARLASPKKPRKPRSPSLKPSAKTSFIHGRMTRK